MEREGQSITPNTPTPMREQSAMEARVASAIIGACACAGADVSGWDPHVLMPILKIHGVGALLWTAAGPRLSAEIASRLRTEALEQAAWEMRHHQIVAGAMEALHGAGIGTLVLKGTGLAYTLYPEPAVRTRGDTDLWIHPDHCNTAVDVLSAIGFTREMGMPGEVVSHQADFSRQSPDGSRHTIDLHWAISNTPTIARRFSFDRAYERSVGAPRLSAHARTLGPPDALLLACIHRLEHHHHPYHATTGSSRTGDRLIWLYDIHLLASGMSEAEWDHAAGLARDAGCSAACADGLTAAARYFGTRLNPRAFDALGADGLDGQVSAYLFAGTLRRNWLDLVNTPGVLRRLRLVRETFLPPPAYIRQKYGRGSGPLPWLYVRRAGTAVARLIRGAR